MNWLTRVFLVALRLAIGWHLFVEGWHKLESVDRGAHEGSQPFSAETYLRESTGPLSGFFRALAGPDPDDALLARLTVQPGDESPPRRRMPIALKQHWDAYREAFIVHYELQNDDLLRRLFEGVQAEHEDRYVAWLTEDWEAAAASAGTGAAVRPASLRIIEYRHLVHEIRSAQAHGNRAWGKDFWARLHAAKTAAARTRAALAAEVDSRTAAFGRSLAAAWIERTMHRRRELMGWGPGNFEQVGYGPLFPGSPVPLLWPCPLTFAEDVYRNNMPFWGRPPLEPPKPHGPVTFLGWDRLEWINFFTRWGLAVIGACLILGLLTRFMCAAGAVMLLTFYLAMLPTPELASNPRMEGYCLFINKTFVEMLALALLATTRSGYWVGLDGLLKVLNPLRWFWRPAPK